MEGACRCRIAGRQHYTTTDSLQTQPNPAKPFQKPTQPQILHKPSQTPTKFTLLNQRWCTFCKGPRHNRSKCQLLKFDRSRLPSQPTHSQDKRPISSGTNTCAPQIGVFQVTPKATGSFTVLELSLQCFAKHY